MKVLIVEDSRDVTDVVETCFLVRWPDTSFVRSLKGEPAAALVEQEAPDLVVLDLGLPDISGSEVLKRVRGFSDVPVIILTGRDDEASRVRGLEAGADDYVVKPFSHLELLARVQAVLRRTQGTAANGQEEARTFGPLSIDFGARKLTLDGEEVHLTRTEWELLSYLVRNTGQVASHNVLASRVWGSEHVDSTVIKTAVGRLRDKLREQPNSPRFIHTHRGMGYQFAPRV